MVIRRATSGSRCVSKLMFPSHGATASVGSILVADRIAGRMSEAAGAMHRPLRRVVEYLFEIGVGSCTGGIDHRSLTE